ncbi:MAG: YtxH domain-containing protein [Balneolaceae bacterium]|nr:YtxH domain-containing protein [Balneolaceae bacterium]
MTEKKNTGLLLLAASSFLGGVGLGLLLSPRSGKQNREWITDHTSELADWVDEKSRRSIEESEKRLAKIRSRMRKGYRDNIPDLYEATEYLGLDGSELVE